MNIFQKLKATLRYDEAVRKADEAHEKTGNRYYVMPVYGSKGKLIVIDRPNFRIMKKKGYISRDARVFHLEKECFYCTPYRNGSNGSGKLMPGDAEIRRKSYMTWYSDSIKRRKKK